MQYAVKVVGDIIPRVPDMTGVEAYPDLVLQIHAVDDFSELLKAPAHLCTLARHRFQQDGCAQFGEEDAVECVRDQLDPLLSALTRMRAGVKIIVLMRKGFHSLDILLQHIQPVEAGGFLCRTQVHRVAAVGDELAETLFFKQAIQRRGILGDDVL